MKPYAGFIYAAFHAYRKVEHANPYTLVQQASMQTRSCTPVWHAPPTYVHVRIYMRYASLIHASLPMVPAKSYYNLRGQILGQVTAKSIVLFCTDREELLTTKNTRVSSKAFVKGHSPRISTGELCSHHISSRSWYWLIPPAPVEWHRQPVLG